MNSKETIYRLSSYDCYDTKMCLFYTRVRDPPARFISIDPSLFKNIDTHIKQMTLVFCTL